MKKYIIALFAFLLPIVRRALIQVAADELTKVAYPTRKRTPRTSYAQPPRGYTDQVTMKKVPTEARFHDVLMVAFDITGPNRALVSEYLAAFMPPVDFEHHTGSNIDSWWIADDNFDGDCDSAVFVTKGKQEEARELLRAHGLVE